ncbi:MAG: DUF58 domain-containing protein, partial [Haloquadratum sp.]
MRPTRRGYAVLAVLGATLALGTVSGARALDAVAVPAIVALVGAAIQAWRAPTPELTRTLPPADVPGTAGTVEVRLRADRSYPVTLRDRHSPGVDATTDRSADAAVVDATTGGVAVAYTMTRRRRGVHEIGPATVVLTDVLGLVRRTVHLDVRDTVFVFPAVRTLSGRASAELRAAAEPDRLNRREEFAGLREYVRGDALRDVHWKSTAKRGQLVVRELAAERDHDRFTVAVGVAPDAATTAADAAATAAATVCLSLLEDGVAVELSTPEGSATASPGSTRPILAHLARLGTGPVPDAEADADAVVSATGATVTVRFGDRERNFASMTVERARDSGTAPGFARDAEADAGAEADA